MHPPAALRRTLTVTIIPVTFASGAATPGAATHRRRSPPGEEAVAAIGEGGDRRGGRRCGRRLSQAVNAAVAASPLAAGRRLYAASPLAEAVTACGRRWLYPPVASRSPPQLEAVAASAPEG